MGFTFEHAAELHLDIDGKEYAAPLDNPEFIDFWRNNSGILSQIGDESNPHMAAETVRFCVDMITALLGADASKELFDGKQVSLIDCASLIGYVMSQIAEQGMQDKLIAAASRYGRDSILR